MAGEWYLGPAGDLRALECPERDVNVSDVRYGGVDQGLSAAPMVDVTGGEMQIDMTRADLDEFDFPWFAGMPVRHTPCPVSLITPPTTNLTSAEASMSNT